MKYTEYLTQQGDRWDTIAYKAYGDATIVKPIIDANKEVYLTEILPAGRRILVPIIENEEVTISADMLPPWKR